MFDAIHHIAIIGSDYERSKHFYVDLLGFQIIRENYRAERDDYKIDLAWEVCYSTLPSSVLLLVWEVCLKNSVY